MKYRDDLVFAIRQELKLRHSYLKNNKLDSIYFGGGTPSILPIQDIQNILSDINKYFDVDPNAEITLESNPDDLTAEYLKDLRQTSVNRLSIGVQSFQEEDLLFMNRAHNSQEALRSIKLAQDTGFENITIDLIYGTPTLTDKNWNSNLQTVFDLQIPHLSSYSLTIEPKTALHHFIKKGKISPLNEQQAARQFEYLMAFTNSMGMEQYEISNFAKNEQYAVHNTNYWKGVPYLGIGPAAHSYNQASRQWNVAHNMRYIKGLRQDVVPFEFEELSDKDLYNEYIMTALRTKWGVSLELINKTPFAMSFLEISKGFESKGLLLKNDYTYILSQKGKLLADAIMSDFFEI